MRLDHIGVATDDADGLAAVLTDLLEAPVVHEEVFDGLRLVFLDCGDAELELLEPVEPSGPVGRFLERRGAGLHHLAFETDDVGRTLAAARSAGIGCVDETPRPGARGHRVGFLHPESTGGVLIEFVEH